MKFQNFSAFDRHLNEAAPHNLASCYALITKDERSAIASSVFERFDNKNLIRTSELEVALSELQSMSLLGDQPLVYLDEAHKLTKKQWDTLIEAILAIAPGVHLIIGADNLKNCSDLATRAKSNLVMLDLSKEKPWDKDKRVIEQMHIRASKLGKKLDYAAADYLMKAIGPQLGELESILEKLSLYVGESATIDLRAAQSLVRPSKEQSSWQLAEGLIWDKRMPRRVESKDFPMLIGSLRYQLELGLCIALDPASIKERYPTLRPKSLSRFQGMGYSATYFQTGLKALLDSELAFKNGVSDGGLCFDLFAGKLLA